MMTAFEFSILHFSPQTFWLTELVNSIQRFTIMKMNVAICFRLSQRLLCKWWLSVGFYTLSWLKVPAVRTNPLGPTSLWLNWLSWMLKWCRGRKCVAFSQVMLWKPLICFLKERRYQILSTNEIVSPYYGSSFLTSMPWLTWTKCITVHHPPPIGHNIFTAPTAWCPWQGIFLNSEFTLAWGSPIISSCFFAAVICQIPPNCHT
jgi:hypothetical protein